ncbi:hypothetical protein WG906_15125 [Pedobacter sp. P351]|uniref:hypothetical protein n=1 Tax=Pedobacter superstes TaxID=3133441 RepID=UPI0030B5E882
MKVQLTPPILDYLIGQGYTYCLSRTQTINKGNTDVTITLTPVTVKPRLETLPLGYDTYFNITQEPKQMALGVDETEILVDLVKRDQFILHTIVNR